MAAGNTSVSDIVVPELFTPYVVQETERKSSLLQSGALVRDPAIDGLLSGGGLTFSVPSFKPLDNDSDNVSSDDTDDTFLDDWTSLKNSRPNKIGTATEIAVRLSRNNSWASADLAAALAGTDPMEAIGAMVSDYWAYRLQAAFIATMTGVFGDNDQASPEGQGTQYDLTNDVKGASFSNGVTNFTSEAFLDALVTMGDSMEGLGLIMVHSIVYNRMQKLQLIDFIPDAVNPNIKIPTYLGRRVIMNDAMPVTGGVFESWIFGAGACRLGVNTPKVATEVERKASAGNGGGQEVLHNRVQWAIHPAGHAYNVGAPASGGPSNAATTGNLADHASWGRVFPERKQIKIARLVTREF